jgi:plasmid stabilization system protein ParE
LVEYAPGALRQVDDLLRYYEDRQRDGAADALRAALQAAERRIDERPNTGLPAPRPYRQLARPGVAWIKAGRYWVSYTTTSPPVIVAVYFETANIPGRL